MSKNNFWAFLKWYFKYTTKEFFDNSNSNTPSYVGNKERLPFIIISYLIFITSFVILFIHINGIYWFSIFGFIISIGFLFFVVLVLLIICIYILNLCERIIHLIEKLFSKNVYYIK